MTILTIYVNGMEMMLERSKTPRHVTLEDKLVELMDTVPIGGTMF
jgi:hypothetical protein